MRQLERSPEDFKHHKEGPIGGTLSQSNQNYKHMS